MEFLQDLNPVLLIPALGLVVFVFVRALSALGFLKDGTMQRVGVIVGTFVTSAMVDEAEQALSAVLIGFVSVAVNEFAKWVGKKGSK